MKISIITCTYNNKQFLKEAIESVQNSILTPLNDITFEHLIYDDASTDDTADLFNEFSWNNVAYYAGTENRGPSYGRNFLLEKATGDYIFMLDSDDIILQRTLYNFAILAKTHTDTFWFIDDFIHTDSQLRYMVGQDYYGWDFKTPQEMLTSILKGEYFLQSNVFYRKDLWKKVGGFDESMRMAEDLDLFMRFLLEKHMPIYSSFITHLHRYHDHNLSKNMDIHKHMQNIQQLQEKYHDRIK